MNLAEARKQTQTVEPLLYDRKTADEKLMSLIALEVVEHLRPVISSLQTPTIQPALLDVKQAAIYLGRTEASIQSLVFQRVLPVVRYGRRVHLHRKDLDAWIDRNKE